jgi:hypothetical protein
MEKPSEVPEVKVTKTTRPRKVTSGEQRTRHNEEFQNKCSSSAMERQPALGLGHFRYPHALHFLHSHIFSSNEEIIISVVVFS